MRDKKRLITYDKSSVSMHLKRKLSRANLSMVIEENPNLEQIYPFIDKPYYVDQVRDKID
jgi:hypothetical protein